MGSLGQQFERDGFLVLPDFCSAGECDLLIQRAASLSRAFNYNGYASIFQTNEQSRTSDDYFLASGENISFFFEKDAFDKDGNLCQPVEKSFNKIGHALHDLDPVFDSFSHHPRLQALAEELELRSHILVQSMYIFKHAKIGGVVDLHQDASFLYTEPASCIGFWFALEDANTRNGCLWAKPGGHRTVLRQRFCRLTEGGTTMHTMDPAPLTDEGMVPLEVKKGTCIVLHGLLPHFSLPNTSGKSRQAYALHSIDSRSVYPSDNWLQRTSLPFRGFNQ